MDSIKSILSRFEEIQKVVLFGSRSLGTFHQGSDIDLALVEGHIDELMLAKLNTLFSESSLPYKVDFVDYSRLEHPELKEHIDRVGKVLYERIK